MSNIDIIQEIEHVKSKLKSVRERIIDLDYGDFVCGYPGKTFKRMLNTLIDMDGYNYNAVVERMRICWTLIGMADATCDLEESFTEELFCDVDEACSWMAALCDTMIKYKEYENEHDVVISDLAD